MDIEKIPFGSSEEFNVFIEIPEGSGNKYELDEGTGFLNLNFVFRNDLKFPCNYGLVPHTRAGDGDRLDVMVFSTAPLQAGSTVKCKAFGMIEILDRGEVDNKILAVPIMDPLVEVYTDIGSLSEDQIRMLEDFHGEVAAQKNKIMEIKGFFGKERAREELNKSKLI